MYETLSQPLSWPQCFTGIDTTTLQRYVYVPVMSTTPPGELRVLGSYFNKIIILNGYI